ncbi:MAG: CBS domain-containing protein [Methanomassiliicoccaceae archaeon]|jgi:CBS domain-containing protein|nr:CBS domain-containing protein [Methanomassiliicoccaceae archaeon]
MGVKDLQDLKKLSMLRSQIDGKGIAKIMNDDFKTVGPDDRVVDALHIMKETGAQDIPVVDNGEYVGSVGYGTLLKKKSVLLDSKVRTVMTGAPSVDKTASITDVAELMIRNNSRQIPVIDKNKKIKGVVSRSALIEVAAGIKAFREIRVWEIMSSTVETVKESDVLDTALDVMRGLDIRTVPVIDSGGAVVGIVGMKEIIDHNWRRKNRQTVGDLSGERGQSVILVDALCATAPRTISWDETIGKAAEIMLSACISTLPVVENKKLVGILTQYDIIEMMAACKERDMMFVQISGLDDDDKYHSDIIDELIKLEMAKIAKIQRPQSLTLHVAKYNAAGDRHKYSLNARLILGGDVIAAKEIGWDLPKAVEDVLEKLGLMVADIKSIKVDNKKKIK